MQKSDFLGLFTCAVAGFIGIAFLFWLYVSYVDIDIDRCLDRGGAWDEETSACFIDEEKCLDYKSLWNEERGTCVFK